jgi:hypothetical protein
MCAGKDCDRSVELRREVCGVRCTRCTPLAEISARECRGERRWAVIPDYDFVESTLELLNSHFPYPNSPIQAPNSPVLGTPTRRVKRLHDHLNGASHVVFLDKPVSENRNCRLGPSCNQPSKRPVFPCATGQPQTIGRFRQTL